MVLVWKQLCSSPVCELAVLNEELSVVLIGNQLESSPLKQCPIFWGMDLIKTVSI